MGYLETNIHDTQPPLHNLLTKIVVDKESQQKNANVLKTIEKNICCLEMTDMSKGAKI